MYIEKTTPGLNLSDLITVVKMKKERCDPFPLNYHACRCSNCKYLSRGKCSLKECCCISDRVKAHTCAFSELLYHCFSNIKNSMFHYRLRIAAERATELHTCFISPKHRSRFNEGIALSKRKDRRFIAEIFLLSTFSNLWKRVRENLSTEGVMYNAVKTANLTPDEYTLFAVAWDMETDSNHLDIEDLSDDEIVDFDVFRMIVYAIVIYGYSHDAIKIADKKDNPRKRVKNG